MLALQMGWSPTISLSPYTRGPCSLKMDTSQAQKVIYPFVVHLDPSFPSVVVIAFPASRPTLHISLPVAFYGFKHIWASGEGHIAIKGPHHSFSWCAQGGSTSAASKMKDKELQYAKPSRSVLVCHDSYWRRMNMGFHILVRKTVGSS